MPCSFLSLSNRREPARASRPSIQSNPIQSNPARPSPAVRALAMQAQPRRSRRGRPPPHTTRWATPPVFAAPLLGDWPRPLSGLELHVPPSSINPPLPPAPPAYDEMPQQPWNPPPCTTGPRASASVWSAPIQCPPPLGRCPGGIEPGSPLSRLAWPNWRVRPGRHPRLLLSE